MHQVEQNRTTSNYKPSHRARRHGVRARDPHLILRSDRIFAYREGCNIQCEYKRTDELLDYVFDLTPWLDAQESITNVIGWTCSQELMVTAIQFTDTAVKAHIYSGKEDHRHVVTLLVSTNTNKAKEIEFALHTKNKGSNVPVVLGQGSTALLSQVDPIEEVTVDPVWIYDDEVEIKGNLSAGVTIVSSLLNIGYSLGDVAGVRLVGHESFSQTNAGNFRLNKGEQLDFNIQYQPSAPGKHYASLYIDVGDEEELQIKIKGSTI